MCQIAQYHMDIFYYGEGGLVIIHLRVILFSTESFGWHLMYKYKKKLFGLLKIRDFHKK